MASENNKRLYKHYLSIAPLKAKQAAVLLERFPELGEKEEETPVEEGEKEEETPAKEGKEKGEKDGKKPKR